MDLVAADISDCRQYKGLQRIAVHKGPIDSHKLLQKLSQQGNMAYKSVREEQACVQANHGQLHLSGKLACQQTTAPDVL